MVATCMIYSYSLNELVYNFYVFRNPYLINLLSPSSHYSLRFDDADFPYQFSKHATRVLGNYPAPPAFASEFPRKDAALRFNSASPSSIHVTAGIIQIRNMSLRGTGISWSYGKDGRLNVVLSFGLSRVDDISADSGPASSIIPNKAHSAVYRGWFYFMCMWVLFLTMSFKIGSYICAK